MTSRRRHPPVPIEQPARRHIRPPRTARATPRGRPTEVTATATLPAAEQSALSRSAAQTLPVPDPRAPARPGMSAPPDADGLSIASPPVTAGLPAGPQVLGASASNPADVGSGGELAEPGPEAARPGTPTVEPGPEPGPEPGAAPAEEPTAPAVRRLTAPPLTVERLDVGWPDTPLPSVEQLQPPGPPATRAPGADPTGGPAAATSPAAAGEQTQAREAAERALQACLETSAAARRELDAFVARTNELTEQMAAAYRGFADDLVRGRERDLAAIDRATAVGERDIEAAADAALGDLELLTNSTGHDLEVAGRRAYALIAADDLTASRRIGDVVSGLVSGHVAAFNSSIARVTTASQEAVTALQSWRDGRADRYPTSGADPLEAATNEARQLRIPAMVDRETKNLSDRTTRKTGDWARSRDATVCGLACSYRGALDADRRQVNAEGRASVAAALAGARNALQAQSRSGTSALQGLRRSFLGRLRTQAAAARSHLDSQTRSAAGAAQGEAHGAVTGVQSAARGAVPSYTRAVTGLAQTLRGVAAGGAPALHRATERTPGEALRSLQGAGILLDGRLQANLNRLVGSLTERRSAQEQAGAAQCGQWTESVSEQTGRAREQVEASVSGFREAFGGMSASVSQASSTWARTLAAHSARTIATKRAEAAAALHSLLTGESVARRPAPSAAAGRPRAAPGAEPAGGAPDQCADCADRAGMAGATSRAPAAGGAGGAGTAEPAARGLTAQTDLEVAYAKRRATPWTFFDRDLTEIARRVSDNLTTRAVNVGQKFEGGFAGTVDEEGVIAQLRGLTALGGRALDLVTYPTVGQGTLDSHLRHYLGADSNDYRTASAYLRGNAREGARLELKDSIGFFNDDEARMEATLRALSPSDLRALGSDPSLRDVRESLGGTDLEVYDALLRGEHAAADAYRLRDAIDEARQKDDADAVHRAIEEYTRAPGENDYRSTEEMSSADRRAAVVTAFAGIVRADVTRTAGTEVVGRMSEQDIAVAYVSREVAIVVPGGPDGGGQVEMRALTGANRDLADALLRHGENSVDARAARLGVELQRSADPPNAVNIDRAVYDERFAPDPPDATPEQRAANEDARERARADRARVMLLAERYAAAPAAGAGTPPQGPTPAIGPPRPDAAPDPARVRAARGTLVTAFRGRFGDDAVGADLAAGLLTDERPSARTASLVMQHAMYSHVGTNEELLFRFTERMTRSEVQAMRVQFHADTGRNLDAELGVFGEGGTFTELSGDDRLRMERAMRGVPQTDRERLENAAFALDQQRRETGRLGAWLAEGTLAERMMQNTERELDTLAGGHVVVSRRGDLVSSGRLFDAKGDYTGPERNRFLSVTGVAQTVAEAYSKRIDAFADVATTGIAIIGAIAAAAITVATGGAAAPLIAAAVITGLASMSANYAIKGGRYGWEQAAIDLGMTAVQAITAGVGAQLGAAAQVASKGAAAAGAASRSLSTLARLFTGNPVVDQIIIGAVTGSIGGMASTAFDERTWEHGGERAAGALFSGLLKGALAGASTAALTQSIEALGRNGAAISDRARALAAQGGLLRRAVGEAGRGVGGLGRGINAALNSSTQGGGLASAGSMAARGLARGSIAGLAGMAGRTTEVLYDAAAGKRHGDASDALGEIGRAGLHSFVQGVGEGAAEAVGQRVHNGRLVAAGEAINEARRRQGREPIPGDALGEHSPLRSAAEDLVFLDHHGSRGRHEDARAQNLQHVAANAGLGPAVASVRPPAIVEDAMRAELVRHVPPEQHGSFADVPIRVLPEAEYRALTRSESGPVVTLIQDGHPVVVVREGTPIARLSDEGPHLVQARDAHTRQQVARLDEATMARWDSLDLDTQLDLYRTKIALEIDAHERIVASLESTTGGDSTARDRIAIELQRATATLENLRARQVEVTAIDATQRAAIEVGGRPRPQYLEQPPRLFSKDTPPGSGAGRVHEGEPHTLPTEPPEGHPQGDRRTGRLFDETPEQLSAREARRAAGQGFDVEMEMRLAQEGHRAHHEVRLVPQEGGRGQPRADTVVMGEMIAEHKHTQLAEIGTEAAIARINELTDLYHPGARIAEVPSTAGIRAEGEELRGQSVLIVPEQRNPVPRDVLEHAARNGVLIRDAEGRVYSTAHPHGDDRVVRASARDPETHAEAMQQALMRHVPAEHRAVLGAVPIDVLPARDYLRLTQSRRGPVVTIVVGGELRVVVREGTPISRLADEGPHLSQSLEAGTKRLIARLDERTMSRWHELDLDTQVDLYRTKLALEIDGHERIVRSLEGAPPQSATAQARALRELARQHETLRNLRARQAQVEGLGPAVRAAIRAGVEKRPPFLNQPARLFSKDAPGAPTPPTEAERASARQTRPERQLEERRRAAAGRAEKEAARTRRAAQEQAMAARTAEVGEQQAAQRQAAAEGRLSAAEDLQVRLADVAAELHMDVTQVAAAVQYFTEVLGGAGRRADAKEVIDSLRNRVREGQPPRYGDLEGVVHMAVLEQNALAVELMRAHLARSAPDVVLGVERGGAFLAQVLTTGAPGSPPAVAVPKHVEPGEGGREVVRRTPHLEAEIRRRIIDDHQRRFAIVDFYMGGVFAEELVPMLQRILEDHPYARIEVLWMRETYGFERTMVRPAAEGWAELFDALQASGAEGLATAGVLRREHGKLVLGLAWPAVVMAPVAGRHPGVRVEDFPVDLVLGDDLRSVMDAHGTRPVRIADRSGRILQTISVGTPDPETGRPLTSTRDIVVRLMQGARFPTTTAVEEAP